MTPSIRKTGFQTRVVMAILLIGMVSVALGLASVYFFGRASLEKSIGTTYKELAIITAKNLDTEIAHHLKEAHTIAATNDIIRVISESNGSYAGSGTKEIKNQLAEVERRWASDAGVDAYLHALLTNRATDYLKRLSQPQPKVPVHLQILVTDIKGAAVAATKRPRHYDFSDTEWWKAVIEKEEPYLSGIVHSEEENTFLFNMAVPVRDKLGQVIGALYMVHNAPRFFQVVTEVTSGRSDHTMLVSSDGVVIFCPILPIKSHLLSQSHQQLVLRDKPGWVSSLEDIHYSGEYAINGFAPVSTTFSSSPHNFGGNRWYILTSQDPEEAFAPIYDLLKWVALSGVLGALVVAILGSITARSIIRPIQTLREGVEFISGGNLEHTITVHSGDEIEDLAKAFNQMGEKLKASYSGLEAKIAERTRELEANNRELFALYAIVSSLQQAPGQDDGFVDALNKIMVTVPSDAIVLTEFATGANTTLHAAPRSLLEDTNFTKALDTLENHLKEEKQALTIEDLRDSAQFNLLERDLGFLGVHSMPIIVKSRLMGILHLFNREPRVYTATERTLVNSITNQLGTTLENVQLSR